MSYLKTLQNDKRYITLILSVCIFLGVFVLSSFFYTLNRWFQNKYYTFKDVLFEKQASKDIIVVEIDEKTLASLGRFPFSREVYVPVLQHLQEAQAGVVWMDIIFADTTSQDVDTMLAQTFKNAWNVVIWNAILDNGQIEPILPEFQKSVINTGFFPPLIDRKNNTVYSVLPSIMYKDGKYDDHFSIAVLKAYYAWFFQQQVSEYISKYDSTFFTAWEKLSIPLAKKNSKEILINYINGHKFQKVSFVDVYDEKSFKAVQKSIDFTDKIILIGTAAKGIKDVFSTPNGIEYGVYIHANMINTILKKDFLVYFNKNLEWLLVFLLIILSVYFNLSRSSYILIFSNVAIITIFLVLVPIGIIIFTNVIINYPTELIFALVLSLTVSNIVKYLIENVQKDKLNRALSEYVSEDIAAEVLSWDGKINLDGEEKKVTIFFSDIEWFTTISEELTPATLLPYLRDYLTAMSNVIIDGRGFINKYEWDAIMALWWVFGHEESMEYDACDAALLQIKLLKIMNKKLVKKQLPVVSIRIGIHCGEAVIGNIGARWRKIEFTALWDNVNLASRLEGVNKFYGTHICVSQEIYRKTDGKFEYRLLDTIRVKGKTIPIRIYELVWEIGKLKKSESNLIVEFEKAIELYQHRDFEKALKVFSSLAKKDTPSKVYVERCNVFLKTPPPADWDGVWDFQEK